MVEEIKVGVGSVQEPNQLSCPRCSAKVVRHGFIQIGYRRSSLTDEMQKVAINFVFEGYRCTGCERKFAPWFTPVEIHTILRERCAEIGVRHQLDAVRIVGLWRAQLREVYRQLAHGREPLSELGGDCSNCGGELFGQVIEVERTPWDEPFDHVGFKCTSCGIELFDKDQAPWVAKLVDQQRANSRKWQEHLTDSIPTTT